MKGRILHVNYNPHKACLYAGDNRGTLFQLGKTLKIEAFCTKPLHSRGLHVLQSHKNKIIARDTVGNIISWNADHMSLEQFIVSEHLSTEATQEKQPMPVPSSALAIWNDKFLTINACGHIIVLDQDLALEQLYDFNSEAFSESINVETNLHLVGDCAGNIWFGSFDEGVFVKKMRTNYGNVHVIRYDHRHERFWSTTDTFGGIFIFDKNGTVLHKIRMTVDDVEWLVFNEDCTKAYIACFDHYLYVYDNTQTTPSLVRKIGPFKFQLKQVLYVDVNHIYVLLESGEVYHLNGENYQIENQAFGTNCIWGIDKDPNHQQEFYCALESGQVAKVKVEFSAMHSPQSKFLFVSKDFAFGRIRRVLPLANNMFLAITTAGVVFKADLHNHIEWKVALNGICRDIDINQSGTECIVGNEAGELVCIAIDTGKILWMRNLKFPIYSVCYDYLGGIYVGERTLSDLMEEDSVWLYIFDADEGKLLDKLDIAGYCKRMRRLPNGRLLINGNGAIGAQIIDMKTRKILCSFNEWLLNTTENAIVVDDYLYALTYGYQINTYCISKGEIIDSQMTPEDYPKAIVCIDLNDKKILAVGGRTFLSLYDITTIVPQLLRTHYLD